jgi:hypothetical protein
MKPGSFRAMGKLNRTCVEPHLKVVSNPARSGAASGVVLRLRAASVDRWRSYCSGTMLNSKATFETRFSLYRLEG